MDSISFLSRAALVIVLLFLAVAAASAQTLDELRIEVQKLGSFEYEDLMSDNVQILTFTGDCTLRLQLKVNWHDGGGWTAEYTIPLGNIRLDGMLIRQHSLEEPPGLFLETFGERIDIREDREGTVQNLKQYQVFIRTENDDDAVHLTAYLRRIISSCLSQ